MLFSMFHVNVEKKKMAQNGITALSNSNRITWITAEITHTEQSRPRAVFLWRASLCCCCACWLTELEVGCSCPPNSSQFMWCPKLPTAQLAACCIISSAGLTTRYGFPAIKPCHALRGWLLLVGWKIYKIVSFTFK